MKLFTLLNAKDFARDAAYFINTKRAEMVERFWNYAANCVLKALESGDLSHLNKAAQASVVCGFDGTFRRVIPAVAPFKFDRKAMTFTGKVRKGKRELLTEYVNGVQAWERILKDALAGKTKPRKDSEFTVDSVGKRAKTIARNAFEAGLSRQDCKRAISDAFAAVYGPEVRPQADKTPRQPAPTTPAIRKEEAADRADAKRERLGIVPKAPMPIAASA